MQVWSVGRWVCLRTLHGRHEDTTWPCCMAISPDGTTLVTGSTGPFGGSTIKAFLTGPTAGKDAGTCLATFSQLPDQKGDVSALLFSSDGGVLYSGASDGSSAAWRLRWGTPAHKDSGLRRGFL